MKSCHVTSGSGWTGPLAWVSSYSSTFGRWKRKEYVDNRCHFSVLSNCTLYDHLFILNHIMRWEQCCGSKHMDPNLRFWPNLDPDPGLCYQLLKKKFKINFEKNKKVPVLFIKNYKNKMSPKEIFSQLSLRILNLYLKSFTFCLYFILVCMYVHVWIRIHKAPEYGSGSTTLQLAETK